MIYFKDSDGALRKIKVGDEGRDEVDFVSSRQKAKLRIMRETQMKAKGSVLTCINESPNKL